MKKAIFTTIVILFLLIVGGWVAIGYGVNYLWENRAEISESAGEAARDVRDGWERGTGGDRKFKE